jgi:hypothetical protein
MENNLSFLSTRRGFNTSLKHFKLVNGLIKRVGFKENLADLINGFLEEKEVSSFQFPPILNSLLVEKFQYYSESFNLKATYPDELTEISNQLKDWDKVDIILTYFHPQLGQILINPKNDESWESVGQLKENELMVIYVGYFNNMIEEDLAGKAIKSIKAIINHERISNAKLFKGSPVIIEKSVESPMESSIEKTQKTSQKTSKTSKEETIKKNKIKNVAEIKQEKEEEMQKPNNNASNQNQQQGVTPGKKRLSPHFGVLVTNELFHNGNVEAWKKIIASYEIKYPDTKVLVFYEGEQIQDINTLFKWGKVKHGTNIYFALLGVEHRDTSKLRRYLAQGASPRFEDFLRGDPTKALILF